MVACIRACETLIKPLSRAKVAVASGSRLHSERILNSRRPLSSFCLFGTSQTKTSASLRRSPQGWRGQTRRSHLDWNIRILYINVPITHLPRVISRISPPSYYIKLSLMLFCLLPPTKAPRNLIKLISLSIIEAYACCKDVTIFLTYGICNQLYYLDKIVVIFL